MRIAIAGNLNKPIVENSLGGTETFTYELTKKLVEKDHQVTVYASSDSHISGNLESICSYKEIKGLVESEIEVRYLYQLIQSRNVVLKSNNFDIIHNNYYDSFLFNPFSVWAQCPIVTTVHSDFFQYQHMRHFFKDTYRKGLDKFVFVSKKARELAQNPSDSLAIYNGIDIDKFPFTVNGSNDYLLWLSRIIPQKGPHNAVQVALKTGYPLILTGAYPRKLEHQIFFENEINKYVSNKIKVFPAMTTDKKNKLYKNARAFIFPIQWEEPFGLVLIEAMACGTPVIAYAKGAIPEIIKDGETGFIVNSSNQDKRGNWIVKKTGIEGLIEASKLLFSLPDSTYKRMRLLTRKRVEQNFTLDIMVNQYQDLYIDLIKKWKEYDKSRNK